VKKSTIVKLLCFSAVAMVMLSAVACSRQERSMMLATTTSTQDSGLLDYLLPKFEKDTGIKVRVLVRGTGEAMEIAKRGDADSLLVHAKEKELQFISEGYGTERLEVMYNDFVLVGHTEDPGKISSKAPKDAVEAFKLISSGELNFISRGDESGTHSKEKSLWKATGITPKGNWYISAGKGMGAVLQMADEKKAYTLTDRATYLSMKGKLELIIITEKGANLNNQYSVIRLNPKKNKVKEKEAEEFINWMLSEKGQNLINEFGKDKYGQSLFTANGRK
jgi:tungstate transport system substrate-binding protein